MKLKSKLKKETIFIVSMLIVLAIVVWGIALPSNFENVANATFTFLTGNFSWLYVVAMNIFLAFAIWLGFFSKYKNIKLGPDDSTPEYKTITWFAMLFSAGMGIGLVFWGIAEPLSHYLAPVGAEAATVAAQKFAMEKSFLHWGLHPWANYCIMGLGLAYMQFRMKKPAQVSSIFIPLLGEKRANGGVGKIIDILAVFATAGGMATSLGLGTYQINSGLNYLFGIPENTKVQLIIVISITFIYTITAVAGIDKGISLISNINMIFVGVLLIGSFVFGPTVGILNNFVETTGLYLQRFLSSAMEIGGFEGKSWYSAWTIFYWAWFISWAPFVGVFIARISKGRTIKEFVAGVTLVPAILSFIWFAIFGGIDFSMDVSILTEAAKNTTTAFFIVMAEIPLGFYLSLVTIILLFTFFITSANSATFVLGMLTDQGKLNPSKSKMTIWGILMAGLTLALMVGSKNGLQMLQTISVVAGFPFIFIMFFTMYALKKALDKDPYIIEMERLKKLEDKRKEQSKFS
ncbi:BCCT family transporter [Miniphocaeibacter massiliensis]|uniref:BCCT family transporter n=1 Tax=Miniphocaeibacter massiliensis TaxID=2041841 RepID=UPI000C0786DD|nr:BCCT family transporter [Miniphocaeibacter massiliensis]